MNEGQPVKKWYEQTWVVVLFLIFFFPVGLFLMWRFADWPKVAKIIVTIVIGLLFILGIVIQIFALWLIANIADDAESGLPDETLNFEDVDELLGEMEDEFGSSDNDLSDLIGDDTGEQDEGDFTELERLSLSFDDREWEIGFEEEQMGIMIREYVTDGETVQDWTELVTAQFFPDLQEMPLNDYADEMKRSIEESVDADVEWNILYEKDNDLMYEFILKDDGVYPDQHEIARVIKAIDGMFVVHYAIEEAPMSDEKHEQWKKLLEEAQLKY